MKIPKIDPQHIVAFAFLALIAIWGTAIFQKKPEKPPEVQQALIEETVADIHWYSALSRVGWVIGPGFIMLVSGWLAYSKGKSWLKAASVHLFKIGDSEIVVHEKDIHTAAPVAMGLVTAKQLEGINGGTEKAFEMYTRMADAQTKQISALVGRKGALTAAPAKPQKEPAPAIPQHTTSSRVPTFNELLTAGEIAPGRPMILGYENGVPRRGSFLDIYSAAVAGESGSGKTATLLFLIGSALIASGARFFGIDPHYPHPKSLGYKAKPLWEAGLMRMATFKEEMLAVLAEIERTIDRRLQQIDTDATPVVLVIDEVAFLSKSSIGSNIADAMERIAMEGRKCNIYGLFASQTWLASRTGNSSVIRDMLTSAYVHRIKPKQANLLLQDKEETEKVKKHIKHAGDVLFCPVNDDSAVCRMPFATESDMLMVADRLKPTISASASATPQKSESELILEAESLDAGFQRITASAQPAALPKPEPRQKQIAPPPISPSAIPNFLTPDLLINKKAELEFSYRELAKLCPSLPTASGHNKLKRYASGESGGTLSPEQKHDTLRAIKKLEQSREMIRAA